jgi:hypothetical protein
MADKEFLGDRRRNQEEEYFQRREQELIAKVRRRREETDTRQRLMAQTGSVDTETLDAIESLGYTPETIVLLDVVPLLMVAWAEGRVSDEERQRIIEVIRARGVKANTLADQQLTSWLTVRPSDELFDRSLDIIAALLEARPPEEQQAELEVLLVWSRSIASASGGVLGFGRISGEEEAALARIRERLLRPPQPVT